MKIYFWVASIWIKLLKWITTHNGPYIWQYYAIVTNSGPIKDMDLGWRNVLVKYAFSCIPSFSTTTVSVLGFLWAKKKKRKKRSITDNGKPGEKQFLLHFFQMKQIKVEWGCFMRRRQSNRLTLCVNISPRHLNVSLRSMFDCITCKLSAYAAN